MGNRTRRPSLFGRDSLLAGRTQKRTRKTESFSLERFEFGFENFFGAMYGDWIGSRQAGSPGSGDVIYSFPYAIEFLLREYLFKTDADIDTASFDTAHDALSGWTIRGAISDARPIGEHLENLANQCKCSLLRDDTGKYYLSVYDASAAVTYTDLDFESDSHLGNLRVFRTDPNDLINSVRVKYNKNPASGKFTKETFIECRKIYSGATLNGAIDNSTTTVVVTDGTLFTTAAGGDRGIILIDREVMTISSISTHTLTVARAAKGSTAAAHDNASDVWIFQVNSDDGYGTRDQNSTDPDDREDDAIAVSYRYDQNRELIVEADMVGQEGSGTDTTALNLRNHLFDYYSVPRYAVEFDSFLMVSDLKVTDIIEFDATVMDSYLLLGGQSWSGKKFKVTKVSRRGVMDHRITAIEL